MATIGTGPTALAPDAATGAAVDPPLAAGTAAGEYVVERAIGAGGMGDVYAGRHPVIGKRVAIKVLRREVARRPDAAERFLREARAVNQVDHPNVVDVFALGRLADGRLYLVMDLLDGESLRERLRGGPLAPALAFDVLRQLAGALDAAHARGVIHRDLKPDNVVLTGPADRPTAHVLDFGIAKLLADAGGEAVATLTGQGAWMGTPAYMAPEQWTADGATAASDRYALGVLAYELITGKPPFHAPSLPAMMEQHFRAAVPSVATAAGLALPAGLDAVFARALAKEPEARPATAQALVDALDAALAGRAPLRPATGQVVRWAGAAGVVVAVAAGAVLALGGREGEAARRAQVSAPPVVADGAIAIVTTPAGAVVTRAGVQVGTTPMTLTATPGATVDVELSLPGYVAVARSAIAMADRSSELRADLALATGFDGEWTMPDGTLRAFERRGDQVAGFALAAPAGKREFLRFFAFVPSARGAVAFLATEPYVAEAAPDEPSCNIPLRAEYVYRPADDTLELRKERAQLTVADGRCTLHATAWSPASRLVRLAQAPRDADWAESRAGASATLALPGQPIEPPSKAPAPSKPIREPIRKPIGKLASKQDVEPPDLANAATANASPPPANDLDNVQGDGPRAQRDGPVQQAPPVKQPQSPPPPKK